MVKRLMKTAMVASLIGLVPMASARAVVVCGGTTLTFCVDFTLAAAGPANTWNLTVTYLSSNSTDSGVLSDFGIFGVPTATATAVSGAGEFHLGPTNCDLQDDACASADAPPTAHGLVVGESATLTFTATGFNGQFSSTVFGDAHIISYGDESCSIKVSTGNTRFGTPGNNGGSYQAGNLSSVDQCGGTTTTPEPASIFLVGSGLAGLAGLIRRRRAA